MDITTALLVTIIVLQLLIAIRAEFIAARLSKEHTGMCWNLQDFMRHRSASDMNHICWMIEHQKEATDDSRPKD